MAEPPPVKIFKVAELNRLVKAVLEDEVGEVWVEGEISNLSKPASGHIYFTLKDASSQLRVVMFRGDCRSLKINPASGLQVKAFGRVTVYEAGGQFQLVARRVEPLGAGALQAAFEELKRKLREEGLFEASRKRPMPFLPRRIGLITSPTGAVIRDLISVLTRRFQNIYVLLAPVRVQGAGAAEEIAAALDLLNERGGLDVLVLARGGGSLEDLWAFNEEIVARAIARSRIPVVSAVGHETDVTISDFVADLRAPTPSAAAELIVPNKNDIEQGVAELAGRLARSLRARAAEMRGRFAAAAASYVFKEPEHLVRQVRERLERRRLQLERGLESRFSQSRQKLDELQIRLARCLSECCERRRQDLRRHEDRLRALSPLAVLARGYSVTTNAEGKMIVSPEDVRLGECITTRLARGLITSSVVEVR